MYTRRHIKVKACSDVRSLLPLNSHGVFMWCGPRVARVRCIEQCDLSFGLLPIHRPRSLAPPAAPGSQPQIKPSLETVGGLRLGDFAKLKLGLAPYDTKLVVTHGAHRVGSLLRRGALLRHASLLRRGALLLRQARLLLRQVRLLLRQVSLLLRQVSLLLRRVSLLLRLVSLVRLGLSLLLRLVSLLTHSIKWGV